ncbi:MAG: hypothetical protein RMJ33_02525 [Saprospiraceae bacterium]|nr:hypothetical protein [Saprospiraceae bacterium]MDW8228691.1 hypothetical protein [Saprospiraceae bacterium]
MRVLPLLAIAFVWWQCKQTPKTPAAVESAPPAETTLRGYFSKSDQGALLRACPDGKKYRVNDATRLLDSLYEQACMPAPIPGEAVYAVLTGVLSDDGQTFTVQRADTLTSKGPNNACLGWEFWASGTEPFWSLQISEAEGSLFFKDIGLEEGQAFAWSAPKTDGKSTWTYESGDLKAVIKKAKCSDGMSELEYNYSVELNIAGRKLRGCAIRSGEPMPTE